GRISRSSPGGAKLPLHLGDPPLVPAVEGPLLDALAAHEPGPREDLEMLAGRGLADAELVGDEHAAHAVAHEIPVHLAGEVRSRRFQPVEDLQPALVPEGLDDIQRKHIGQFAKSLSVCQHSVSMSDPIERAQIEATHAVIRRHVRLTPVAEVSGADFGLPPFPLTLKLELLQHSGSFRARGAFANLLMRSVLPAGVVAASGGNHGAAVAYAAMRLGVTAKIFVPIVSSPAKIQRIRESGADLGVGGGRSADAPPASGAGGRRPGALPGHASVQAGTLPGRGRTGLGP